MLELSDRVLVEPPRSGLRHGFGLFETIRVRGGEALRLDWHLERLAAGAAFLGLDAPPPRAELEDFARRRCGLGDCAAGVLRLYAYDASLELALTPGLPPPVGEAAAGIASTVRRLSGSPLCRFKTLSYLENILLVREAEGRGCFDLIALNEAGRLADGGRTNLFLVREGEILTPPVADGALPGVARRALLEAGLVREAALHPADLETCEAAFLANALRLVLPLHRLGGRELPPAHPRVEAAAGLFRGD